MKKYKCSQCGYYLPKEMFYNEYNKGYMKVCSNCVTKQIRMFMEEIRKRGVEK